MRSYLPRESVCSAPTTGGALVLLLDTRSGRMFQLNPTGASAGNTLLIGGGDIQAAARTVAQYYRQPYLQAFLDLGCLIQRLVGVGLVEPTR